MSKAGLSSLEIGAVRTRPPFDPSRQEGMPEPMMFRFSRGGLIPGDWSPIAIAYTELLLEING